ncbi:MAG: hypothetical protein M1133_05590 [Armatimonadetes bacterium]|nr:hypothetical protein [Armatimonadota bacterium]
MADRYTDWAIAIWIVVMGLLFLALSVGLVMGSRGLFDLGLELVAVSRCVYLVVVAGCVISVALRAVRGLSNQG